MTVKLTKSKPRHILAGVLLLASFALYIVYPDSLWVLKADVPLLATLFMPLFLLCVAASLLLEVSLSNKAVRVVTKILALLGCLLVIFYASEVLLGRHFWELLASNPGAFFYGYCVVAALAAFFFALTGSVPWGLRLAALLVVLYGLINYFALMFRGSPFIPQDFYGLGTAADVASSYSLVLSAEISESLLAVAGVFFIAPRLKFAPLPGLKKWSLRAGVLVLSLVFFFVTVSKPFFVANDWEPFYFEQWQSAENNGSIVNFLANIADAAVEAPEGYSVEAVNALAAHYVSDSASSATTKPDVIVILGESWADIVPDDYAETSEPVAPFISSFAERDDTLYGSLIVSSKGGGTSRQEFQFLTGANDEYGLHTAPFLFLVDDQLPSIVESFSQLDYQTTALHPGTASAWNRDTAFPALGFDSFLTEDDLGSSDAPVLRGYLRDSVMYDKALAILNEADEDTPNFIYAISIATHGGYGNEEYPATIHLEEPEGSYAQTEQYLSLLNEADKDLEAFIAALEERERPTLVLFFGDHLPNFDNSYDTDVLAKSDPLWRYKTIYGVWANYELPADLLGASASDALSTSWQSANPQGANSQGTNSQGTSSQASPRLSLSYLNLLLMQAAGLPLTGYQKFLLEGAAEYPVSSLVGYETPEGTLIPTDEAQETLLYQQQAVLQYNFVYDRGHLPDSFFFLLP